MTKFPFPVKKCSFVDIDDKDSTDEEVNVPVCYQCLIGPYLLKIINRRLTRAQGS